MKGYIIVMTSVAVLLLFVVQTGLRADTVKASPAEPTTGEQINWQVISSGGTKGSSTDFQLSGTVGQTTVGYGSSTNFGLSHGFWQEFAGVCCSGIRGNADGDPGDAVNVADLTYLVDYLFFDGPAPPCEEEGDVEGSGAINVADLTYLVDYLFMDGPPPPPCGGSKGADAAHKPHSGIELNATYENGTTAISLESSVDLRGIQIELAGWQTGVPIKLVDDDLELFFHQKEKAARVGILDMQGSALIRKGSRFLVRLPGQYEIVEALVSDLEHNALIPTINPTAKGANLPTEFSLNQNYPNPFNPATTMSFSLPDAVDVKLEIYNIMGQKVTTLIDDRREAGNHVVQWDGSDAASGIYFYRITAGQYTESKKMLLLK